MDAKLLSARAEIEAVIAKYDIAACVMLHNAPGNSESFTILTPSYSRVKPIPVGAGYCQYKLYSHIDDYKGDRDAQLRDLAATANMVTSLAELLAMNAVPMLELAVVINKATNSVHTPMTHDEGPEH